MVATYFKFCLCITYLPDSSNHNIYYFPNEISVLGKGEDIFVEVDEPGPVCETGQDENGPLEVFGEGWQVLPGLLLAVQGLLVGQAGPAGDAAWPHQAVA